MKKVILLIFLFLFSFNFAYAGGYTPIVPCTIFNCTLCDFFQMIANIVGFIQHYIAAPLAVLMIIIGAMFMVMPYITDSGGEAFTKARSIFKTVAIGLIIIWGGWIILNLFLTSIGVSPSWWQISC
ncbi:MAG: hypothetical protein PHH17_03320 [Candidatus Pacebacteria bacterium]|nr:hypothetical protein [Candidatus Paceibacterota bacterium]MDD3072735.1 hypothetical protein [Candidatus Paceibacterota bacterium]MDD3729361.1 hypothetical protein [Candidatus Paceibacterota bacterium]MDD4201670.1 hypothetical protein [Candidatus Paceibacterota bacterium]MDD4897662.1 hypothetical protein [Candidatus Paceibacterota bacterium]